MKALGWWLMVVGSLRLASVYFGFFNIWALRLAVFSQSPMTDVHGRTFGVWTLLTCTLCFLCAFNLENRPLYTATFLSFIYALGHFLTEYLIYQTMAIQNLTTVGFFAGSMIKVLRMVHEDVTERAIIQALGGKKLGLNHASYISTSILWMLLQWNSHQRADNKNSKTN